MLDLVLNTQQRGKDGHAYGNTIIRLFEDGYRHTYHRGSTVQWGEEAGISPNLEVFFRVSLEKTPICL
ncbi:MULTISPECIES: hypothetical protein [unclassified Pseudomonas]|uniref:hypothetical protein n=1 Tax=unclassified Pseudomonas TaxID=196821 RepID=UPI001CBFD0B0|nr:hypothetical protein [Pseudomonas sp. GL-B-26]